MLHIALHVPIPFLENKINTLFTKSANLTEEVALEVNVYKSNTLIAGSLIAKMDGDHPGVFASLGLLSYEIEIGIYGPHAD